MAKILVVDDDADACILLKQVLTKAGYEVDFLPEGHAIVEQDFKLPDMFILDNTMPTIDGIALCKFLKLQSHTRNIPVLVISGNHQLNEKASKAGAADFLAKPFCTDALLQRIAQLLKQAA